MRKPITLILFAIVTFTALITPAQNNQGKPTLAMISFWTKFQAAVVGNERAGVVSMTKFPLQMPYGVPSIRNRTQFIKSYGKIFDAATIKCFSSAKPEVQDSSSRFYIGCGEAMMYWFERAGGRYRFSAVDNVNE